MNEGKKFRGGVGGCRNRWKGPSGKVQEEKDLAVLDISNWRQAAKERNEWCTVLTCLESLKRCLHQKRRKRNKAYLNTAI